MTKLYQHVLLLLLVLGTISAIRLIPRIVNADGESEPHQFPYVVSLRIMKSTDPGRGSFEHFCGGAIVSEHWIISAAHCLKYDHRNITTVFAFVGAHFILNDGVMYAFKQMILHPDYDPITRNADISLSETLLPITFSEIVQPIPISTTWIEPGYEGIFTGWGVTQHKKISLALEYIKLRVIPNDMCVKMHNPRARIRVLNSMLCTYIGFGAGTCFGDSGGVLTVENKLIGVLSWGIPCGVGRPDQFIRVSDHVAFIKNYTKLDF